MKKTPLLLTIIFAFVLFSISSKAQTTLEEYNYVTKGYKVQIESGLDMKKGYEIENIDEYNIGGRNVFLKKLIRTTNKTKTIAAYIITYQKAKSETDYICIPNPNSDSQIINLYIKSLYNGSGDSSYKLQLIAFIISRNMIW